MPEKIADQIIDQGADYVLSLKGKQGNLHDDIKLFFKPVPAMNGIGKPFFPVRPCIKADRYFYHLFDQTKQLLVLDLLVAETHD
jgi:hypothetical protein